MKPKVAIKNGQLREKEGLTWMTNVLTRVNVFLYYLKNSYRRDKI
jgi:hypothetical protein